MDRSVETSGDESEENHQVLNGLPAGSKVLTMEGGLRFIVAEGEHPLKGRGGAAELKLERAKEHFNAFRVELSDYYALAPWTIIPVRDGVDLALVLESHSPVPDSLALIAGDLLHNLRSALDCIVMELAELGLGALGRPPTEREERSLNFPIVESSLTDRQQRTLGRFLSVKTVELLRMLQPSEVIRGGLVEAGYEPNEISESLVAEHLYDDPLLKLSTLNNWDEHRRLTFSFLVPASASGGTENGKLDVRSSQGELASLFDIPWLGLEAPSRTVIDDPEILAQVEEQRATIPEDDYDFHFSWWPLTSGDEIGRYIPIPGHKAVPDLTTEASLRLVFFEPELFRQRRRMSKSADRLLAEIIQGVESTVAILRGSPPGDAQS